MKRVIFLFVFFSMFLMNINAEDESTLNLDTEGLKNKQEDYSSLTDINGMNIFTNDMQILLSEKHQQEEQQWKEISSVLFTPQFTTDSKDIQSKTLFTEPVLFNKTIESSNKNISIVPILFVGTVLTSVVVYIITKRLYQRKGSKVSENNINI